jgi:tRNA wybutosine-synthesizing protein 2
MEQTALRSFETSSKLKQNPKPKDVNAIEAAIRSWLEALPEELVASLGLNIERLLEAAPKRWIVYPPMVLLPSGSFAADFCAQTQRLEEMHKDALWKGILDRIGKKEGKGVLSHLAVNSGIPLNKSEARGENILRTPNRLVMLFGDFGLALPPEESPSLQDFESAFWVSTKQNGITQVWAPRYTMFSRGNVKEKARLLEFHGSGKDLESRTVGREELGRQVAVDLYAGIGYFVFSYVKMGMGRVLGWELNPWSVEGLRRGALANGWNVKVVREGESWEDVGDKIVVCLENNGKARERLKAMKATVLGRVSHINAGLLPTSEASWKMSLDVLKGNGWLHLHENVGVSDVEKRKVEIEEKFQGWLIEKEDVRQLNVEHVEFVKTFAPGVWHCVFDLYISSP